MGCGTAAGQSPEKVKDHGGFSKREVVVQKKEGFFSSYKLEAKLGSGILDNLMNRHICRCMERNARADQAKASGENH